jgi:hypothetical protein
MFHKLKAAATQLNVPEPEWQASGSYNLTLLVAALAEESIPQINDLVTAALLNRGF